MVKHIRPRGPEGRGTALAMSFPDRVTLGEGLDPSEPCTPTRELSNGGECLVALPRCQGVW